MYNTLVNMQHFVAGKVPPIFLRVSAAQAFLTKGKCAKIGNKGRMTDSGNRIVNAFLTYAV